MKRRDLGWAWKPDEAEVWLRKNDPQHRPKVGWKPKRKKERKRKRHRDELLFSPGEVFYNSKRWQKIRLQVLQTYGRKCMQCDRVTGEMHVDHIKPRSRFPKLSLTFDNLQVLCRDCNMEKLHHHSKDFREESVSRDLDLETALMARSIL